MTDETDRTKSVGSEHSASLNSSARSEFDLIERLRARAATREITNALSDVSSVVRGIGDDAAVIRSASGRDTIITTDLLIEDIDFHRDSTQPALLGHKALAVSLSDVA